MKSGQPKATLTRLTVGRFVMLDEWPYKPMRVTHITKEGVRLTDPHSHASKMFTPREFNEAGYVFAEMDEKPVLTKDMVIGFDAAKAGSETASATLLYPNNTRLQVFGDPFVVQQIMDRLDGQVIEYRIPEPL